MARYHGFIDPVSVLARISRLAQPSEVAAPLELVRAGVVFHARGLVNTKAIQQNLDWVWPYWVRRQFDPADVSFLPGAFSITHVNLTHRNWTAIGTPDHTALAIVDPAGLLTPLFDGWSLDAWVVGEGKEDLLPAYAAEVDQTLHMRNPATGVEVHTRCANRDHTAVTRAYVEETAGAPVCTWEVSASSRDPAWLVVSLRPYNPEGVSFVHHIQVLEGGGGWQVGKTPVRFDVPAQRCVLSCYHEGDVHHDLLSRPESREVRCDVGMASAAALFVLKPETVRTVTVSVSLEADEPQGGARLFLRGRGAHNGNNARNGRIGTRAVWEEALEGVARLSVPDARFQFLYDAAVRSLILHSAREVYPGPYTYKRFWFRDAAFILHSMLCIGLVKRAEQVLDSFPSRQRLTGYFHSQDGEWDSNGEALWIMQRWCELSGWPPK
ncbi:MAG: hypothetical protein HYZ00_03755 [Candidatus Hydrogenedentes bacterium]|nr:hypothetical protein [Candidatus Hydrogenedentota bacterium]